MANRHETRFRTEVINGWIKNNQDMDGGWLLINAVFLQAVADYRDSLENVYALARESERGINCTSELKSYSMRRGRIEKDIREIEIFFRETSCIFVEIEYDKLIEQFRKEAVDNHDGEAIPFTVAQVKPIYRTESFGA